MRQIVLDTETTGLSAAQGDRIIEIGCVELFNRQLTGNNRHFYLQPDREIHEEAQRVHGITQAFLADKPRFAEVADDLIDYLAGAELIIHNAPFDLGFLDEEWRRLGRPRTRD
jgi:DNA polymerase III subunit epsilon